MRDVAADHGKVLILIAVVEAQPEAEAVRQRDFFFDCLGWIDRRRALVFRHVARHQVAPVGRRIEDDVVVTEKGHEVLSKGAVKEIKAIEKLMAKSGKS